MTSGAGRQVAIATTGFVQSGAEKRSRRSTTWRVERHTSGAPSSSDDASSHGDCVVASTNQGTSSEPSSPSMTRAAKGPPTNVTAAATNSSTPTTSMPRYISDGPASYEPH